MPSFFLLKKKNQRNKTLFKKENEIKVESVEAGVWEEEESLADKREREIIQFGFHFQISCITKSDIISIKSLQARYEGEEVFSLVLWKIKIINKKLEQTLTNITRDERERIFRCCLHYSPFLN